MSQKPSDSWKLKIKDAARTFIYPQRTVDELASSITGIKSRTHRLIYFLPAVDDIYSRRVAFVCMDFGNSAYADKMCDLLNSFLFDAAEKKGANYYFRAVGFRHVVGFMREDSGRYSLASLCDHLREVEREIRTTGQTLAEHVRKQELLFHELPDRPPSQSLPEERPQTLSP